MDIRRRKRRNRLQYTLYRMVQSAALVFKRMGRTFSALRPAGRAIVFGIGAVLVGGIALLIVKPGNSKQTITPPQGSIVVHNGSVDTESNAVLELPSASATPSPTPVPTPTPDPSLYEGVADSERVTELQTRLMNLDYLDIDEPTQHFGPATKDAVQRFQRQHQLKQDGIAGADTLNLIFSDQAKKYTLLEGTSGTDVDNFQRQLKSLGYLSKITGYYGTETLDAVKAFQKENGLHADGKAGEQTFDMINSDKAKQSPTLAKEARRKANINTMIATAKKHLGDKYVWGNQGPNSFDCSGLVYYCMKEAGSNRRRVNAAGYSNVSDWQKITSMSNLKAGDLIFYYNNARSKVGHVAIYVGNGQQIDASSSNGKVVKRSAVTPYWKSHFVCGRRPW